MTTSANDASTTPAAIMTPVEYGVGARFTLSIYDSDYVRIILGALAECDATGLTVTTNDISTFVTGSEQRVVNYISDVIAVAAASGAHLSAAILLSRGCPGELACALPQGVYALAAAPIALDATGVRARAHWSLYPLLDGASGSGSAHAVPTEHMGPIYAAIEEAKRSGIFSGSDHFATRLDGDLAQVLQTAANAWIGVGAVVQHVVTHLTVSINSPSPIRD
ncbi:Ykof family thiamine-binding protein [Leucobacter salsicius]|uniref:Ykof family thiamine-binding protein n=1 Tax=Leucobacter salsicius TaxID=664638 RepID=UPI001E3C8D8B|nr:Ykof family thiamine-binding protein [Leucobacter salsicius]